MDPAAAVAAGMTPSPSSQPARKDPVLSAGNEEMEPCKLGQSDERTIYERGTEHLEVDFCSITIDGSSSDDVLQQRLHDICREKEELQQMEIELRAHATAKSVILKMQQSFDTQMKPHANTTAKLKEKLQEREQCIHELEVEIEKKDRSLRAIKIDKEAAWAKEDLLREQNKELATFLGRENSEAERAQHLKQIHDLKEHIQVKESQFHELEEQHRAAQEAMIYKEEQLRGAQAWVACVQEMEAMHSTTNYSLRAEIRERIEQFNQFWLGCQRQFTEMERHHMQTVQQLQQELAEAREHNSVYTEDSRMIHENSKDATPYAHDNGNQSNVNKSTALNSNSGILLHGNIERVPPFVSADNPSTKAIAESSQAPSQTQYQPSQKELSLLRADTHYDYELSTDRNAHSDCVETHISSQHGSGPVITASSEELQVVDTNEKYLVLQGPGQNEQAGFSQLNGTVTLNLPEQKNERKANFENQVSKLADISASPDSGSLSFQPGDEDNAIDAAMQLQESVLTTEPWRSPKTQGSSGGVPECKPSAMSLPEVPITTGWTLNSAKPGKTSETKLMDERSLLACIVRAIPSGASGRIRISTTLPNRLGKMLSPLHWYEYKKQYGKLHDFVVCHPELFVIEGDFIHLRDGAQEIISVTTAATKVAAAASAPYSSSLSSVAITPVAETHHLKRVPTVDAKLGSNSACTKGAVVGNPVDDRPSQLSAMQDKHSNAVCSNIAQSHPKISSESNDIQELKGFSSEMRPGHSSVHITAANESNPGMVTVQNKGPSNGRNGIHSGGRQQARASSAGLTTRR
ncbi:hypothetical protein AAC387_Pa08g1344 [Persea americana]